VACDGWIQYEASRGLFAEHEGACEQQVLDASLAQVAAAREIGAGPKRCVVVGGTVRDRPACALVLCADVTEGWEVDR
jgi:hypothetical protein